VGDVLAEKPDRLAAAAGRCAGPVRRRTVFYVHGFDPRGPAPYHRMFVEEAARQAAVSGAEIDVGARRRGGRDVDMWEVRARFDGVATRTTWVFLRWDDVVRRLWTRGGPRLVAEIWAATAVLWRTGLLGRSWRRARPLALALLLPVASTTTFQALAAAGAAGLGLLAWWGARRLALPAAAGPLLALAVLPIAPLLALSGWRRFDAALRVSWLVQSMTNIARAARDRRPEVRKAAEPIAERILEAAAGFDADEVLVVGHSYGAAVAVMALARALELDPRLGRRPGGPAVSFLTLGQSIAAWDHVAQGGRFHQDLEAVVRAGGDEGTRRIAWVDVTSPSDGASSSWLDPCELVDGGAGRPVRRSPHFHLILSRERFRRIRMRPFDYHFQYLRASEASGGYDFFRLACGPERLCDFGKAWTRFVEDRP
jgi:hypothetical protein